MKEVAMEGYRLRAALLLLLAFTLPGCGGGSSPENVAGTPDTGSTPPPAAPATPDPVTPDDDASAEPAPEDAPFEARLVTDEELSPLDPFTVEFNQPVDSDDFQNTVMLRGLVSNEVVPLDLVESEADQLFTLKPRYPLTAGSQYVLDMDVAETAQQQGKVDGSNVSSAKTSPVKPLPPVIVTAPSLTKSIAFYDDDGAVDYFLEYRYHETGKVWMTTIYYSGPGLDDDWTETDDNPISTVYTRELLSGNSYLKTKYVGSGLNGIWDFGGDDEIGFIELVQASGLPGFPSSITSEGPGVDGEWFTADDGHYMLGMRRFDVSSRELVTISGAVTTLPALGPGEDGDWFTGDDRIEEYSRHQFDSRLKLVSIETFRRGRGEGDDGIWFTEDDEWTSKVEREYDDLGRLSDVKKYFPPGPFDDGIKLVEHKNYRYEGDEKQYRYLVSHDKETGEIVSYISMERNEDGVIWRNGVYLSAGLDKTWFTSDDSTAHFSERVFNADGTNRQAWSFSHVGGDGLPYTGDENVSSLTLFEYDEKGRLLEDRYFTGPGDNGIWNTDDDHMSSWDTYYVKPGT
jgi:hypothetical protein